MSRERKLYLHLNYVFRKQKDCTPKFPCDTDDICRIHLFLLVYKLALNLNVKTWTASKTVDNKCEKFIIKKSSRQDTFAVNNSKDSNKVSLITQSSSWHTIFPFCNKTPIYNSRLHSTKQLEEKDSIRQALILYKW